MLQCVAVCCSVLSAMSLVRFACRLWQCVAVCCGVLHSVWVCCRVLSAESWFEDALQMYCSNIFVCMCVGAGCMRTLDPENIADN